MRSCIGDVKSDHGLTCLLTTIKRPSNDQGIRSKTPVYLDTLVYMYNRLTLSAICLRQARLPILFRWENNPDQGQTAFQPIIHKMTMRQQAPASTGLMHVTMLSVRSNTLFQKPLQSLKNALLNLKIGSGKKWNDKNGVSIAKLISENEKTCNEGNFGKEEWLQEQHFPEKNV